VDEASATTATRRATQSSKSAVRRRKGESDANETKEKEATNSNKVQNGFFAFFDGELSFAISMWKKPGLCYHLGMV